MATEGQRRSRSQERRIAASVGGRTTPASGAVWFAKNDVRNERYSIECKSTGARSFTLREQDLRIAYHNALLDGRELAFVIDFPGGASYAVITLEHFYELTGMGD